MTELSTVAEELLERPLIGVLATTASDGRPHATPVWFAWERGVIWIDIAESSVKRRHIERDGRVALVIDQREWPYRSLLIRGEATLAAFRTGRARRTARRYLGDSEGELVHRAMLAQQPRVSLRVRVTGVVLSDFAGWDYRAAAAGGDAGEAASSRRAARPVRSQRRRAAATVRS